MKVQDKHKTVLAEINMVPFIDIALILLIIFMVISPFIVQNQIDIKLPKSTQGTQSSADNVITILVLKGDYVDVDGVKVKKSALERELVLKLSKSSKKTVLVKADRDMPIQEVVNVFDIAKKLGAGKLGISVTNVQEKN
jgi:biopolymer transport protein TolR